MDDDRFGAKYQNKVYLHVVQSYKDALRRSIQALGRDKFLFPETEPLPGTPEMLMSEEPVERSLAMEEMARSMNGYEETA